MGRIGFPELIVILIIVLVVFGAGRIPDIMRSLGRGIRESKGAVDETSEKEKKE
jgi:sec-independent protein translocase protein TatA